MNNLFLKIGKFSLNKQKEGNSEGKVVEKARKNETASGGTSRNIPAQSESAKSLSNPVSSSSQNDINSFPSLESMNIHHFSVRFGPVSVARLHFPGRMMLIASLH